MNPVHWVGQHPYQAGGAVFAIGVLGVILLMPKGRGRAAPQTVIAAGYDPGYNAAVVQANTALQGAAMAGQAHAQEVDAGLQAHLADNDTIGLLGKQGLRKDEIVSSTALGLAGSSAQNAVDLATISAGVDRGRVAAAFGIAQQAGESGRLLGMRGADSEDLRTMASYDSTRYVTQANADRDVALAAIGGNVTMRASDNGLAAHLGDNRRDVSLANINGSVAMHLSDNGLAGGLAATAAADAGSARHYDYLQAVNQREGVLGTQRNALDFFKTDSNTRLAYQRMKDAAP